MCNGACNCNRNNELDSNLALTMRSGDKSTDNKLTVFLYLLLRDHLPSGTVEKLANDTILHTTSNDPEVSLSNGWLAQYAEDILSRLADG